MVHSQNSSKISLQPCLGVLVLSHPSAGVVVGAISPKLISAVRANGFGCWPETLPCLGRQGDVDEDSFYYEEVSPPIACSVQSSELVLASKRGEQQKVEKGKEDALCLMDGWGWSW